MANSFYIPNIDNYTVEQVIKKSRFIANLKKIQSREEALDFINSIKEQYKDARHNCWAFLAGPPNSPSAIGYSDDGEPKGTAGPPILGVIQHKNLSMTAIVVTRYFGGIKLGASGLVRAYSGTANLAIENIDLVEFEEKVTIKIETDYNYISNVLNILTQNNITIINSNYLDKVSLKIEVNKQLKDKITGLIIDCTKGTSRIK